METTRSKSSAKSASNNRKAEVREDGLEDSRSRHMRRGQDIEMMQIVLDAAVRLTEIGVNAWVLTSTARLGTIETLKDKISEVHISLEL